MEAQNGQAFVNLRAGLGFLQQAPQKPLSRRQPGPSRVRRRQRRAAARQAAEEAPPTEEEVVADEEGNAAEEAAIEDENVEEIVKAFFRRHWLLLSAFTTVSNTAVCWRRRKKTSWLTQKRRIGLCPVQGLFCSLGESGEKEITLKDFCNLLME